MSSPRFRLESSGQVAYVKQISSLDPYRDQLAAALASFGAAPLFSTILRILESKLPMELVLVETTSAPSLIAVLPEFEHADDGVQKTEVSLHSGLLWMTPSKVDTLGAIFFATTLKEPEIFKTNNNSIFDFEYFPTHLAKYSQGIFFDERLVAKLRTLRFLPPGATVRRITDRGGWANLSELTARIDVDFTINDQSETRTLFGKALVPNTPVRPGEASDRIQRQCDSLAALGFPTSALGGFKGVCYQLGVQSVLAALAKSSAETRLLLLRQAAEFAAFFDRAIREDNTTLIRSFQSDQVLDDSLLWPTTFVDALGTDGSVVYWNAPGTDPFRLLGSGNGNNCWGGLDACLLPNERRAIRAVYDAHSNNKGESAIFQ